jgi:hypothetical protein
MPRLSTKIARRVTYLGIDPGVNGGIAALDERGALISVVKMPAEGLDLWQAVRGLRAERGKTFAMLEQVQPYAGGGRTMGATSAFTFGRGVGRLELALIGNGITFERVMAIKWQNRLGCRTGGDKNISKEHAARLFPTAKITHATADALLLATYCRLEFGSRLDL